MITPATHPSFTFDEISNRHLTSLWVAVRQALDALGAGELDRLLSRPEAAPLVTALAADARRLANGLEHLRRAPQNPAVGARTRSKVLVVDDELNTLNALHILLSDEFDVTSTAEPTDVSRLLQLERPDAVVSDMQMPGLDGLALLDLVQSQKPSAPPVLFVSASSDPAKRLRALEQGAFDFLAKPIDVDDLSARIRRAVQYATELGRQRVLQSTDDLTGLLNRRALKAQLTAALEDSRHSGQPLTAAMVDQDGLKAINDLYGHAAGDASIVAVAEALTRVCGPADAVARLGGDEFALVLRGTSLSQAQTRLEQMASHLACAQVTAEGRLPRLQVSWGLATAEPNEDAASLLARADQALYSMKREKQGKGNQG